MSSNIVRKSISLPADLADLAKQLMRKRRVRTFSNYVDMLVAEDAERVRAGGANDLPEVRP